MIYGNLNEKTLIIGAADTRSEYQDFYKNIIIQEYNGGFTCTQPDFMDMLTDSRFRGFTEPPYVFEFKGDVKIFDNVELCPLEYVSDKQSEMLKPERDSFFDEKRTLGEIYGLDEYDPWDKRTDEEKLEDAEYKKLANAAKKEGNLTGDNSFVDPDPDLRLRRVTVDKDDDGEVIVKDILAVKGLFDDVPITQVKEKTFLIALQANPLLFNKAEVTGIDTQKLVGPDGILRTTDEVLAHRLALFFMTFSELKLFEDTGSLDKIEPNFDIAQRVLNAKDKIYYKFVVNTTLDVVNDLVSKEILIKAVDRGQIGNCCWIIFNAKTTAMLAEVALQQFSLEIFPVGVDGERLVPTGIEMYEEKEEIELPRLWNEKAAELETMTEEEFAKNKKSIKGEEFLFSGSYIDAQVGCILYITPRSYFNKNGEMWKEDLDIGHILPQDIKTISPGVYQTRSREWMSLYHEMTGRGFTENMAFQLYMNSIL